jgi:hypothetical protein
VHTENTAEPPATVRVTINHPPWSASALVLVKGSAKPVSSVDFQVSDLSWFADRFGQRAERSRLMQGPMRPMPVVEGLVPAQGVQQVALVPYEDPVQ